MSSNLSPMGTSAKKGGRPLPSKRSVAMRVASPAEQARRWLRRSRMMMLLPLLGIVVWSLPSAIITGPDLEEPIGGEARRLETAQERLRRASEIALEDPERAEFFVRHAIDLLQTLESPPPRLLAAALEELGILLARNGESESAHWMLEESKALRGGLTGEQSSQPLNLSPRSSDFQVPEEEALRRSETEDSQ